MDLTLWIHSTKPLSYSTSAQSTRYRLHLYLYLYSIYTVHCVLYTAHTVCTVHVQWLNGTVQTQLQLHMVRTRRFIDESLQTGEWKVVIANPALLDPMTVDITVFSRPTSNNEGLVLSPALLCRQINFTGSENIVIYAHLGLGKCRAFQNQYLTPFKPSK